MTNSDPTGERTPEEFITAATELQRINDDWEQQLHAMFNDEVGPEDGA